MFLLYDGHTIRTCRSRKYDFLKGLVRWVPKGTINNFGPKLMRRSILGT